MKKVFIVAGELSGDKLGAWYAKRLLSENSKVELHATGGSFLKNVGVQIYEHIDKLNIIGFIELIKHIRFIRKFLNKLALHIINNNFDEVVVIDFPGFNLRLIKKLKKKNPELKITYLSPPQVWIWGKWRIKKLEKFCDKIIVLFPFEVEWYKNNGIKVEWIEYPFKRELEPYFKDCKNKNQKNIAIIPGSRLIELDVLLPVFVKVVKKFKFIYSDAQIILPLSESIPEEVVQRKLRKLGLGRWGRDIIVVKGEKEKLQALSTCCLALTKPGTVTLELALLRVPSIVAYKASWLTYLLAKMIVKIKYMSLPNLLLEEEVYKEFIQFDCKAEKIFGAVVALYKKSLNSDGQYKIIQDKLEKIRFMLES